MANDMRMDAALSLGRGLICAVLTTLAGMLVLAALVVYANLGDGALMALNRLLKLIAIALGTRIAVGPGGTRGFAKGAALGIVYIALGYGVCALLDGLLISALTLSMELLMGGVIGGVAGALMANLPGRSRKIRRRTART